MKPEDLQFKNLTSALLAGYADRGPTDSLKFLRWFLENIFRQDVQDADDACVDASQDKGIDAILVNDELDEIYLFQSKLKQKTSGKLGDTDLKSLHGALPQFSTAGAVQTLLDGDANQHLKNSIKRLNVKSAVESGYKVVGVLCTNVDKNNDAEDYLKTIDNIECYDASRICSEYVDIESEAGIKSTFEFDVSDSQVIEHQSESYVQARLFLAKALQLTKMDGIADGRLFSRNVRFSLGNTKVNRGLVASIKNQEEHKYFPLYHNGITVICSSIEKQTKNSVKIKDYMVVNGAQSLSSLQNTKSKISDDLKILVKVVAVGTDEALGDKITQYSNNQNAIKPRDLKSNNRIQMRIQQEVEDLGVGFEFEVKRGKQSKGKTLLSNEDGGLALLALDLGEPWSCHQKYKVMDESHSKIFSRKEVTGARVVALYSALQSVSQHTDQFTDKVFGKYNLTKYFVGYVVSEILKSDPDGERLFSRFDAVFKNGKLDQFVDLFSELTATTVIDIDAEIEPNAGSFDYKRDLKSRAWCQAMCSKIKAQYLKDIRRGKAEPIGKLVEDII